MEPVWRNGNRIQLLPGASRYVPALIHAIDMAKQSILFEQYLISSGRFADHVIEALCHASYRGVQVLLLFDAYGAKGLNKHDRQRLKQAGVAIREFNPPLSGRQRNLLARDHRKLLLVDQGVAFTGGFCITDEFLGDWYDIAARVEGPVLQDWLALFLRLWRSRTTVGSAAMLPFEGMTQPIEASTGMSARVIWGCGHRQQAIRHSLQERIDSAQSSVSFCTPYFLPAPSLKRKLAMASRRGVAVKLLVAGKEHDHPSVFHAGRHHYAQLLDEGVQINEYQPRFIHAKYAVVDDWITLGSCNFDRWSLRWNLEANQEASDTALAEETSRLFEADIASSETIDPLAWAKRPWRQRIKESVAGNISTRLTQLR